MMTSPFQNYLANKQSTNPLADAAIALGLPVFPCDAAKQPMPGSHGFKDATSDAAQIRRMFAHKDAAMIGVPTGELTGFIVLDVDIKEHRQGSDWLDANSHRMVQSRTIRTGSGGLHIYFNHPGQRVKNSNDKIAPGIDIRGDGGYVIVPPSTGYQVADGGPIADIPEWLFPVICPPEVVVAQPTSYAPREPMQSGGTAYGLAALDGECDAVRMAYFGAQEHTLNAACLKIGSLVAAGELERGEALSAMLAAGRSMPSQPGKTPWNANEVDRKVRRAFSDGERTPRDVPEFVQPIEDVHPAAAFLAKIQPKPIAKPLPVADALLDVDGVLKMLVDEAVRTSIRPQPFLALGSAICAVGALAGRRYRTSTDLRTNIYIAAIAESGGGKDHPAEITRRAIDAAGLERYLGGETLASGRAVLSSLESHPAKLFQVDEFGLFLSGVTGKRAAHHKAEIWSELLKLYSRAKGVYRGTEYANKKENPRIDIHQPCVSFYGTTTPSTFWAALEGGAMSDGSLARFLVFISDNNRPDRNSKPGIFTPSKALTDALVDITRGRGPRAAPGNLPALHQAPMLATEEAEPYTVPMDSAASKLHDTKLEFEDKWARKVEGTPQASIVNRLGENAAKLALIRAISRNPANPLISTADVTWGWALAEHCTRSLIQDADRFIADTEFEGRLNKALNIIRKHGPCTARVMFQKGFKLAERERREVIDALVSNGLILAHASDHAGAGRPTIRYSLAGVSQDETAEATDE